MSIKNILVATDLSERSDRAMDRAVLLAKQMNATLHVVYVVDDEFSDVIARAVEKNASAELERQMKDDPFFKGVKNNVCVAFGDPWRKIVDLTVALEADLVVLGTHRNRGIKELFRGTTLHRIAKFSRAPLLVAAERALVGYKNVLVGVDFSQCAAHAADLAAMISTNGQLTLVHAYHIPFKGLSAQMDIDGDIPLREKQRIEREIEPKMNAFAASLHPSTVKAKLEMVEGGPVEVLSNMARKNKHDLICLGTHAKPWLVETILGSTAFDMLSYPPSDVLIAPLQKHG